MIDKTLYIYTDGACSGNPGPGGWAALLRYQDQEKLISGYVGHTTNNRMEMLAVIESLSLLKKTSTIVITTDSKYVMQGITIWIKNWKKKGLLDKENSSLKNVDLWKRLDALTVQHNISWKWVKGHSGHDENEIVDAAARNEITKHK